MFNLRSKKGSGFYLILYKFLTLLMLYLTRFKPVFVEIDNTKSFNLDDLKSKISNKTKVVLATYLTGILPDIEQLSKIIEENKLLLIEDILKVMDLNLKIKKQVPMDLHLLDLYHLGRLYSIGGGFILIDSTAHSQKLFNI